MPSLNLKKPNLSDATKSDLGNTGQPSTLGPWPFPAKLIPSSQWPLGKPPIRTFADMTTDLGEATW